MLLSDKQENAVIEFVRMVAVGNVVDVATNDAGNVDLRQELGERLVAYGLQYVEIDDSDELEIVATWCITDRGRALIKAHKGK